MKIAIIQKGNDGFFSRFYTDLIGRLEPNKDEIRAFLPNNTYNKKYKLSGQECWGCRLNWWSHFLLYKLTGLQDIYSIVDTIILIRKIKSFNPDIIHLHVVNQCIINFPLLVWYVNKKKLPIVWTMHDCRAFTGRCSYFDVVNCNQWKTICKSCPKGGDYHTSIFNNVSLEWRIRKTLFNRIKRMVIVTPSKWLASLVKQSFLSNKKILVINNGVDISVFRETIPSELDKNHKFILGIASNWTRRKGLDTFRWLSHNIRENVRILLVGDIDVIEKEGFNNNKVLFFSRIADKRRLISLYQHADVFVNPTLADNFPTTNIEALASGTPVVTYETGGSSECLLSNCGISVEKGDRNGLLSAIYKILDNPLSYSSDNCKRRALSFSLTQFDKYIELYHNIYERKDSYYQ